MSADDREVLLSDGRCAHAYHVPLGRTTLAACGRNAQADKEFERVTETEARERGNHRCGQCPFPDDEDVDSGEGVIADGGSNSHAQNIAAQLRIAEEDDDLPDDLRQRAADRRDEIEQEIATDGGIRVEPREADDVRVDTDPTAPGRQVLATIESHGVRVAIAADETVSKADLTDALDDAKLEFEHLAALSGGAIF